MLNRIFAIFENWIDPLAQTKVEQPPNKFFPFLWHFVRGNKGLFALLTVLGGSTAMIEAFSFYFVGRLVDILDGSRSAGGWAELINAHGQELLLMLCVIFFARVIVVSLEVNIVEQTLERGFVAKVDWANYLYVSRQNLGFFHNRSTGSVIGKILQAGDRVSSFVISCIQLLWTVSIFLASTFILFFQLHWSMAAVIFVGLMGFVCLATYFLPRIRKQAKAQSEAGAEFDGRIYDAFSNLQTLKLFGSTDHNDQYVRQGISDFLQVSLRLGRLTISLRTLMAILTAGMVVTIAFVSIDLWTREIITVGSIAFSLALVMRLNMWLGRLMGGIGGLMRSYGYIQNSIETISLPLGLVDAPNAPDLEISSGQISFENVSFKYDSKLAKRDEIIQDLSLHIKAGEKIGLVGRSGAGKTTLTNLLLRFYDVNSGAITIDGKNIADITQDSLRQNIGVVTQDIAILDRSVRENIGFGREGATIDQIRDAANRAQADDFIQELEDPKGRKGYEAFVGERGVKLSGGQRQRVAIARVLLKDAPILVLDEATSALDSEAEAAIQSQFEALVEGKTVIAIAHRLSTIAAMDRLIILDEGRIAEQGTHDELLALGGIYADLWNRQSGGFISDNSAQD